MTTRSSKFILGLGAVAVCSPTEVYAIRATPLPKFLTNVGPGIQRCFFWQEVLKPGQPDRSADFHKSGLMHMIAKTDSSDSSRSATTLNFYVTHIGPDMLSLSAMKERHPKNTRLQDGPEFSIPGFGGVEWYFQMLDDEEGVLWTGRHHEISSPPDMRWTACDEGQQKQLERFEKCKGNDAFEKCVQTEWLLDDSHLETHANLVGLEPRKELDTFRAGANVIFHYMDPKTQFHDVNGLPFQRPNSILLAFNEALNSGSVTIENLKKSHAWKLVLAWQWHQKVESEADQLFDLEKALSLAVQNGQTNTVTTLLEHAGVKADNRKMPLIAGANYGRLDIMKLLIEKGANVNDAKPSEAGPLEGTTALMAAIDPRPSDTDHKNTPAIVKMLLEKANILQKDEDGNTALILQKDEDGNTALSLAVKEILHIIEYHDDIHNQQKAQNLAKVVTILLADPNVSSDTEGLKTFVANIERCWKDFYDPDHAAMPTKGKWDLAEESDIFGSILINTRHALHAAVGGESFEQILVQKEKNASSAWETFRDASASCEVDHQNAKKIADHADSVQDEIITYVQNSKEYQHWMNMKSNPELANVIDFWWRGGDSFDHLDNWSPAFSKLADIAQKRQKKLNVFSESSFKDWQKSQTWTFREAKWNGETYEYHLSISNGVPKAQVRYSRVFAMHKFLKKNRKYSKEDARTADDLFSSGDLKKTWIHRLRPKTEDSDLADRRLRGFNSWLELLRSSKLLQMPAGSHEKAIDAIKTEWQTMTERE